MHDFDAVPSQHLSRPAFGDGAAAGFGVGGFGAVAFGLRP